MSLRLIELQVALPRTQDIGKMQEQIQQKGQHLQEHLASTQQKQDTQKRKQVNKHEKSTKSKLDKDGKKNGNGHTKVSLKRKSNKQNNSEQNQHPYKGNLLDIEG